MANASALKMFGYTPVEICNFKVEKLMPEPYAKSHYMVVEKALNSEGSNMNTKERLVFAKHKSGYVFPVLIQIKSN